MADIDIEGLENKISTLMAMLKHIAKEQCKDEGIPQNVLISVYLNLAQEAFESSIENLVNDRQNPEGARTFLQLHMTQIQNWVKMAQRVDDELEVMLMLKKR